MQIDKVIYLVVEKTYDYFSENSTVHALFKDKLKAEKLLSTLRSSEEDFVKDSYGYVYGKQFVMEERDIEDEK